MTTEPTTRWKVIGQSVRGASHLRSDTPNQDAIAFLEPVEDKPPVVLAVSDGHGSAKSFRSETGSALAVRLGTDMTRQFLEGMRAASVTAIKDAAERLLPTDIVKAWQEAVTTHLEQHPFTAEELERLEQRAGTTAVQTIRDGKHASIAYGATLLVAGIGDGFVFYLQLGDGDILAVSDQTKQVERPLPDDDRLMANETTSLCMDGAQKLFRYRFQYIHDIPPALILLSTDGYSNSFSTPADFHAVGTDLLEMLQHQGLDYVQEGLGSWLDEASSGGSGDDVTVGIICRSDVIGSRRADAETAEDAPAAAAPDDDPQVVQEDSR